MEKRLSFISIILCVFLLGVFLSRELTESQYIRQIKEIKNRKDSLEKEMEKVHHQLQLRDSLLISNIRQSHAIIGEIERKIHISDQSYLEYEKNSNSIIEELNKLCK
jgi:transcriptional regulator of NAD metabolism